MLTGDTLLIITSVISLAVILVVCLARNTDILIKLNFAVLCVSLIAWQTCIAIADSTAEHLIFWNSLVFFWPTLAALSCFLFVVLLRPESVKRILVMKSPNPLLLSLVLISLVLQIAAILSGRIFDNVVYDQAANTYTFFRGPAYPIYIVGLSFLLALDIVQMVHSYFGSKKYSQERRALAIVLATVIFTIIFGLLTNVLIPIIIDSQRLIGLGIISVNIFILGLAFSIVRYQFLDIRGYVLRSAGYILAIAVIIISYVVLAVLPATRLSSVSIAPGALLVFIAITALLAVSFHPLLVSFNKLTNRIFYRDYYEPQNVLDELGSLLVRTVDTQEIQSGSKEILSKALQPSSIYFALLKQKNNQKELLQELLQRNANIISTEEGHGGRLFSVMKDAGLSLAVRLRTTHGELGYLLLGYRKSGAAYSIADKRLLSVAADQLALGLQNALRFEEIQNFNKTLQGKVDDATRQLRRTNDKLRKLDQIKDDFISMSSHQLRTPLTSIKGYVSMVLDGDAGPISKTQRKLLTQSFISSQRMVYLISDLLNVSRLKTGNFVLELSQSNLARVVQEEVGQLVDTAKSRNLTLTYHRPEQFPALMLDETKLRQVIMNFIDNAVYYTPSGGHIIVRLEDKPKTVELTVTDDGIGVPRPDQHHLFSKFYRAHNAKRARPDGTGLGLFMAKKIILAHGGAVIFKSQEGKGSTFGFSFVKSKLSPPQAAKSTEEKP